VLEQGPLPRTLFSIHQVLHRLILHQLGEKVTLVLFFPFLLTSTSSAMMDREGTCPELKTSTLMSYFDSDDDVELHFHGTHDPEEYLEWEEKWESYFAHHQVDFEEHVERATRHFFDYAFTWWVHQSSPSPHMSWSMLKGAMRQEFVPSTLSEDLRHHLEHTTQGLKPLDEYFLVMKQALQRAGEDDPAWMKHHFLIGLKNQSIIEAMLLRSHYSLDDLYRDVLMET